MAALQRKTAAPEQSDTVFENLPEGEYDGRLVYVADLGMHKRVYKKETKSDCQKLSLGIELLGKTYKDADGNELPKIMWTNPFNIFSTLTPLGDELTFYNNFDPKAKKGDVPVWEDYLGTPVSVYVVHKQGTGENADKVYDNIGSLSTIPLKYQEGLAEAVTPTCIGDSEDETNVCTMNLGGLANHVWGERIQS